MTESPILSARVLNLDCGREVKKIATSLRDALASRLHRRGLVVAISGGIDSSVSAALSVQAIGAKKVFGLLLPEKDSSPESLSLGKKLAEQLGITYLVQDIGPALEAIGCYQWRDEAIKSEFPDFTPEWKSKIRISGGAEGRYNRFLLVVQSPAGEVSEKPLGLKTYLQIVAATSYKQRIRKTIEYFHADRLNYAVVGTPNRLEYDQGFFVKNGDGSADVKPISHLYKSQVYQLAEHLGIAGEIRRATPTTDTYSLPQGQDEFYFSLPYKEMDIALWAYNHHVATAGLAQFLGVSEEAAQAIYKDIETKRTTTRYLHMPPVMVEPVTEINI